MKRTYLRKERRGLRQVVMGGADGDHNGASGANSLVDLLMAKTAKDLALDTSVQGDGR